MVRGPVREMRLPSPCPVCQGTNVIHRSALLDLPYFGEAVQTTVLCEDCGYRHGDLLLLRAKEPMRATLRVDRRDHLDARVARSSSATVRIPELGARVDPGPGSEAFVSNVEGLLHRFRDAARSSEALASSKRARAAAERAIARLDACISGGRAFTLILEDPTGNSDILHTETVREPLTSEEVAELRTPDAAVELRDLGA